MEEAHIALQDANKCLKKATNVLSTLKGSLPNVEHLLDKIIGVRGEWENLIRKHSGSSKETTGVKSGEVLSHLRKVWTENIRSMASLESELPAIRYEEKNAKLEYASLAWELSNKRADSAVDLCDRVNSLLPSLEMSDKRLCVSLVTVLSSIRPAIGDKEDVIPAGAEAYWPFLPELSPLSPLVSSTGWDQLSLSIARPDKSSISLTDSVIATPRVSIRQTLSSGEIARLSLAVETCSLNDENVTHNGDDNDNGKREKTSNSRLVVYDEIDAHVGGEAAVAVARLLKKQGEKRQVIAITHNPVIAAAADFHFVVQREEKVDEKKDQKLPDNQSSMPQSVLKEIYGPIRESELARMTTGKIRTNAGADLAKVLLAEFQNKKSSDPSKIEKLVVLGQDAAKSLLQEQEGSKKKQE
jgi:DNA repair ATPase RecN